MWLLATYRPTTLFSLKASVATSSGGKSLLVPTPYAIKMSLLDNAFRLWGTEMARKRWPAIRDLTVAIGVPERAVVTNLFQKVLRPRRRPAPEGTRHAGPRQQTIAFREYIFYDGDLGLGLEPTSEESSEWLPDLLLQMNYLGKRGSFIQLVELPKVVESLPDDFIVVDGTLPAAFDLSQTLQQLDDCTNRLTFEKADIYSGKRISLGRERLLHNVLLPLQVTQASKSFTLYERLNLEGSISAD